MDKLEDGRIKALTRNILAMEVETVFDLDRDVSGPPSHRPFCNFVADGRPMYVHPELVEDEEVLKKLIEHGLKHTSEEDTNKMNEKEAQKKKDDDDWL